MMDRAVVRVTKSDLIRADLRALPRAWWRVRGTQSDIARNRGVRRQLVHELVLEQERLRAGTISRRQGKFTSQMAIQRPETGRAGVKRRTPPSILKPRRDRVKVAYMTTGGTYKDMARTLGLDYALVESDLSLMRQRGELTPQRRRVTPWTTEQLEQIEEIVERGRKAKMANRGILARLKSEVTTDVTMTDVHNAVMALIKRGRIDGRKVWTGQKRGPYRKKVLAQ